MTTAVLTPALKLSPTGRRHRRRVPRFTPPAIAPGLPSQRMPSRMIPVPVPATRPRLSFRGALSFISDVLLGTLVTLMFLSPFLYFVAPVFTWGWTISVGIGIVSVTAYARLRLHG
jgi:hypothetical protein